MALESLPGSQFWDRLLLLVTDPRKRATLLERAHAPYLGEICCNLLAALLRCCCWWWWWWCGCARLACLCRRCP